MTIAITQDGSGGDNNNGRSSDSEFTLPSIEGVEFVNYVNEEQLDDVMRLVGQDLSEPYSIFTYRYFLHRWPQLCILAVPTDDEGSDETKVEGTTTKKHRRPIGCVVCKIDIGNDELSDDGIVHNDVKTDDKSNNNNNGGNGGINTAESNQTEMNNSNNNEIQNKNNETQGSNNNKVYTGYIGMLAVETTHRRSGVGTALVQRAIHRMQQMKCHSIRLETEVTNKAAMTLYEDRLGFVREELLKKYYLNWGDAYRLRLWLVD